MIGGKEFLKWLIPLLTILHRLVSLNSASAVCDFSYSDGNKIYNYTLTSSMHDFPHGVLSEDGHYKVAVNETILWFQLCDGMIFNHDPPTCADCWDCGGPKRCGMDCSALVANNIGDKKNPHLGVIVKMSSGGPKLNCSLSVSVLCNSDGVQGPHSIERLGTCNYATELKHPSGCAIIINVKGKGWGWFATLIIFVLCLLGVYLLAGIVYRYFFLGIRGIDVIPNLDFWSTLPRKIQGFFASLVRKFKGPSEGYRSSYSPVNF
ncbi:Cln5-like protein [Senna tora]|uniref:Cln5-like protein n=1 Tax=Senna tora TaxID=362788 RepID=A0A834WBM8_9FABA|nr:Cln5-like protein [Senna tora]